MLATLVLSASSLPAANIAWVSLHPADNTPSTAAAAATFTNAPDIGYTTLLASHGHTVTRFLSVEGIQNFPDELAGLNTNDVIIISRSVPSGHYDSAPEVAAWNGISKPMIILGGYVIRNSRLGFTKGATIPDASSNPMRLKVNAPNHPIFAGVALDSTNLMVNPYSQRATFTNTTTGVTTLQLGISVNSDAPADEATILAVVGTAGDAARNGMVVGEFPAGVTTAATVGATVLPAKRLVLLTGSRESGITGDGAGLYDLFPDGDKILLNAITYLTSGQPPLPPEVLTPLVGATNLVAGDAWTFSANIFGDLPRTYQWYKDGAVLPSGTGPTLAFPSLVTGDAGQYQLFVTNSAGWATSTVARLDFIPPAPASITNSLISYWPLDDVLGTKSVDLVSGYDMALNNLYASNLVAGKWGNAFQFNGSNSFLAHVQNAGEAIPIYQHPNFSISLWVNGGIQTDRRVFAEGSTTNNNTLFDLGTHTGGADGTVDVYIRSDGNVTSLNHGHSTATAYDGTWHNVVYVQRDVGNGNLKAQLWVDGILDPLVIPPIRPISANTTGIGALLRASPSAFFNGLIDEVAVWNRALSTEEIGILQVTAITNPPSRLQPLTISSFKADLPAVVSGGSTTLRWNVSKDATLVTITPFGDVTGQTSVGIGSRPVTNTASTTYVLTVSRGVDTLSATTSVAVVTGVASGWTLLDNFDQSQLGNLFASGYWNDTSGNANQVVLANGNRAIRTTSAGISFLNLQGLSIQENQTCTLFFRVIAGEGNALGVTNIVGLTDKSQRGYADEVANIGPVVYPTPFTNDAAGITTNGWYLGARNGWYGGNSSPLIDYYDVYQPVPAFQPALESGGVYNVWIDITNAPAGDPNYQSDTFSVYVQKEGGAPRTLLFQNFMSDRDLFYVEPVLGGIAPTLDKLVVMGNSATLSAIFDDFYLSTGGYNGTVPKAYAFAVAPGPLTVGWAGNQLQITWSNGTLQSSTNVNGVYVDVPGNPTSPYLVTPTGEGTFYRSRQ